MKASYRVQARHEGWVILHDDDESMEYATKEAAFEAAVAAAERSLSEGLEIELSVAGGMEGRFV